MLVPGTASQSLTTILADMTGRSLTVPEYERFADGEQKVAVPGFDESQATIVAATPTDETFIELLQLQDAVREAGASLVTTVIPYLGYARQDEAFSRGEPVSARAVARAVSNATDRVILVTPHEASVAEFFAADTTIVDASERLSIPLPNDLVDPVFLAPDANATSLATETRDAYGRGVVDYFEKTRDYDTGAVTIEPTDTPVDGRDVVLVDDIIATGSTMAEAISALHNRGCKRAFAACVHPLLVKYARSRLAAAGATEVIGTDTIERSESMISAAPVIADVL